MVCSGTPAGRLSLLQYFKMSGGKADISRGAPAMRWRQRIAAISRGALALAVCLVLHANDSSVRAADEKDKPAPGAAKAGDSYNLIGHGGPIHSVKLNAAKTRALTGSIDYSMMFWDLTQRPPRVLRRFDEHDGWIKAVSFLPDETRAVSTAGGKVWIWDLTTGKLLHTFEGHKAEISAVAISAGERWLASSSTDRTVRLWDLKDKKAGPVLKGHTGPVSAVAFSDDGETVYSASVDGTIRSWRRAAGQLQRILYKHGFGINAMIALPGKNKLVFGALNGRAGVVDAETGEQIHQFAPIDGPVLGLALQDKPGLLAVSGHQLQGTNVVGSIRVFRRGDWALIEEYDDPRGPVWAMDFGTNGATLYYGGRDDHVTLWQVSPRKPFEQISGPGARRFEVSKNLSPGEAQFARKCSLCHTLKPDGRNRAGPTLYRLFGRKAGTLPGYPYSDALLNADIVWGEETIEKLFGLGPDHYTPGTKMPLQKISDPAKRKALIAYLKVATSGETGSDGGNKASNDAGKTESGEK